MVKPRKTKSKGRPRKKRLEDIGYSPDELMEVFRDPVKFTGLFWPKIRLYDKQVDIMNSVRDNDETFVPAGNKLGKDFISGLIALWFFCSRNPAKVVTTSVDQPQLKTVLWGEIKRFIQDAEYRLPLHVKELHIRRKLYGKDGKITLDPRSLIMGRVAAKGEGLLGQHLERLPDGSPTTLCIFDEASSIGDGTYESTETWAHRKLVIGNCFPCANFFFRYVKKGNEWDPTSRGKDGKPTRMYRKVIQIKGSDSPNVRLKTDSGVPGVLTYSEYIKRRKTWQDPLKTISLDAEFFQDENSILYPPEWLARCYGQFDVLQNKIKRNELKRDGFRAMGVDTAEGSDSTVWTIVDKWGILKQISKKTPNTVECVSITMALARRHKVYPSNIWFDRGGGGKQHADQLRAKGWKVSTVGFGESASNKKMRMTYPQREKVFEEVYTYKNRRAQMYGILRFEWMDPSLRKPFVIPRDCVELRRQLPLFPLQYDEEGRIFLPPKKRRSHSNQPSLIDIIGHSPDESDSLVLAVYGFTKKTRKKTPSAF